MTRSLALVAALALAAPPAYGETISLATLSAEAVAAMIDATSFPNSIGPRRVDGLKTFSDYGFTNVEVNGQTVELYEADRSWMFGITVLEAGDETVVVCVLDRALGGPTYHTQVAVAFKRGDADLLEATDEQVQNPLCPERP